MRNVVLSRFGGMMLGMQAVRMRGMSVMSRLFVMARRIMSSRFLMMLPRVLVMLGGLLMMLMGRVGGGRVGCFCAFFCRLLYHDVSSRIKKLVAEGVSYNLAVVHVDRCLAGGPQPCNPLSCVKGGCDGPR